MSKFKSALVKGALIASVAAGAIVATTTTASAYVACNRFGECWRVADRYPNYPLALGVVIHDDAWWAGHPNGRWHMRRDQNDDHGFYDHGMWRHF